MALEWRGACIESDQRVRVGRKWSARLATRGGSASSRRIARAEGEMARVLDGTGRAKHMWEHLRAGIDPLSADSSLSPRVFVCDALAQRVLRSDVRR